MAEQSSGGFWSSLPGILTGFAAVITAITGLYLAVSGNSSNDSATTDSGHNSGHNSQVVQEVNQQSEPVDPSKTVATGNQGQSSPQATQSASSQSSTPPSNNQSSVSTSTISKPTLQAKTLDPKAIVVQRENLKLQQPSKLAQLKTGFPVDCKAFPTENTVRSLMSWSNHYHAQIEDAGTNKQRAFRPCQKTIGYRARAHCKVPDDTSVRQELMKTLALCRAAGISWQDTVVKSQ